jgi:hypothetical protein
LPAAERFLGELPARLDKVQLGADQPGWGYHFETQTRNIRYSSTTPNAIATSFVIEGLLDAHEATGDQCCAALALSARPFLLSLRHVSSQGPFFAYVQEGSDLVHNANMLVCGALARLHLLEADPTAAEAVAEATETTAGLQRPDGLWAYAEAPNLAWIDNFHTAYTLDGLGRVEQVFSVGGEALNRGLRAWREKFVLPDGWTPYYLDRRFPLETHCCASAIDLLSQPESTKVIPGWRHVAGGIFDCAMRELWLADQGRFGFRRSERRLNPREFMRWTNAPMFRALSRMLSRR